MPASDTNAKIKKIKISGTSYDVRDEASVHEVGTINGVAIGTKTESGTTTEFTLADTPITTTEINSLYSGK